MPAKKKKSPDAIALLKADHRKVEGLFRKFDRAKGESAKKALVDEICTELSIHASIEEEIFYPATAGEARYCDRALLMVANSCGDGKLGLGVSVCFQCEDAIAYYKELQSRRIEAQRPFVGNRMWVTNVTDPDGYNLSFESMTDAPEESEWSEASAT